MTRKKKSNILLPIIIGIIVVIIIGLIVWGIMTNWWTKKLIKIGVVFDQGGSDNVFNHLASLGMDKAKSKFNVDYSKSTLNNDFSNAGILLQKEANNNHAVVSIGWLFAQYAATVAVDNPEVNFAVIDDAMINFKTGEPIAPNAAGLTFAEEEGSFMVGAAAALKTKTNSIGFIGGVSGLGTIEKFEAGYIAGAYAVNPDIEFSSIYITEAPNFNGFADSQTAKDMAMSMYESGIDIIFHASSTAGIGIFEAAKEFSEFKNESKVWGIGVDHDEYNQVNDEVKEYILTSMLKNIDQAVYLFIQSQVNGTFKAGENNFGLSNDGVGYSTSGGYIDDIVPELEKLKKKVVSGEISVPKTP